MGCEENIQIAGETMQITGQGFYLLGNRRISLGKSLEELQAVTVWSPENLDTLEREEAAALPGTHSCRFFLSSLDSLSAAEGLDNPLVMNFASARQPGGGFLNGATAQEECLCRSSTLYASIGSKRADEMYRYYSRNASFLPFYSDYILLSPCVMVFRDLQGNLLNAPWQCAAGTVAAPNLAGPARGAPQMELERAIRNRLRKFLAVAAREGYPSLVLGAWGCGVFRNRPEDVARCFLKLFLEEDWKTRFDSVVFAIPGRTGNHEAFRRAWAGQLCPDPIPAEQKAAGRR